jgi:hypothetical protein
VTVSCPVILFFMARATRSSTQLQSPPRPPKKRKRVSDSTQLPPQKQLKVQDAVDSDANVPNAGDAPIDRDHAQKILDILEMCSPCSLL